MKEKKLMKCVKKQFMRNWIELAMQQKPSNSSILTNSVADNPLDEHMRYASEKDAEESSEIQKVHLEIALIQEELLDIMKKNKKLEKELMDMEAKWNKRFEKNRKKHGDMEKGIILMANSTKSAKGDTLSSVLKSLRKNLLKRR